MHVEVCIHDRCSSCRLSPSFTLVLGCQDTSMDAWRISQACRHGDLQCSCSTMRDSGHEVCRDQRSLISDNPMRHYKEGSYRVR